MSEFVTVKRSDLRELVYDSLWLYNLEVAGIDNTGAYDEAERVTDDEVTRCLEDYIHD